MSNDKKNKDTGNVERTDEEIKTKEETKVLDDHIYGVGPREIRRGTRHKNYFDEEQEPEWNESIHNPKDYSDDSTPLTTSTTPTPSTTPTTSTKKK